MSDHFTTFQSKGLNSYMLFNKIVSSCYLIKAYHTELRIQIQGVMGYSHIIKNLIYKKLEMFE